MFPAGTVSETTRYNARLRHLLESPMQGINEAVARQLRERKGGDDILPLWRELWRAYSDEGAAGVDEVIAELLAARPGDADD